MQGVTFNGTGVNHRNACKDFVISIGDYCVMKDVKDNVKRANFIAILDDRSTDSVIIVHEVICLVFVDRNTFESRLVHFIVAKLKSGFNLKSGSM